MPRAVLFEAVAHAGFRDEVAGLGRFRLQLAAQVRHVDAQVVGLAVVLRSPDLVQKMSLGHQPARVTDELLQQPPLDRRQADLLLRAGVDARDPGGRQIDTERGGSDHRVIGIVSTSSKRCAHAGQQLTHAERLAHVVVGTRVERRDLVGLLAAHREHDDRHLAPTADPLDHTHAVYTGQAKVEQDHVGVGVRGEYERLFSGGRQDHVVGARLEVDLERLADLGLVVDDEHSGHLMTASDPERIRC